jgi:hypothetical protein
MQIQNGKLYENRTYKYLFPSLKFYGKDLTTYLSSFFKLGIGVNDVNFDTKEASNCIFILFDTTASASTGDKNNIVYKERFSKFIEWLQDKHYYIKDYPYEVGSKHMIVLELPTNHHSAYLSFINGKYSEMYTDKEINKYFEFLKFSSKVVEDKHFKRVKNTRDILTKDKGYVKDFVDIVNKTFNTNESVIYFENVELDFKPKIEEEVFQ